MENTYFPEEPAFDGIQEWMNEQYPSTDFDPFSFSVFETTFTFPMQQQEDTSDADQGCANLIVPVKDQNAPEESVRHNQSLLDQDRFLLHDTSSQTNEEPKTQRQQLDSAIEVLEAAKSLYEEVRKLKHEMWELRTSILLKFDILEEKSLDAEKSVEEGRQWVEEMLPWAKEFHERFFSN